MLAVGQVLRRILMYRILKYRIAWLALSLLGYYLTLSLILFIAARHEATLTGPFVTCGPLDSQSDAAPGYLFTAQSFLGKQMQLSESIVKPPLPDTFCSQQLVNVTYETNTLQGPFTVDRVTLQDTTTYATTTYSTPAGRDFAAAKLLSLLFWGGGLGIVSTAMLSVAIFWHVFGSVLQVKDNKSKGKGLKRETSMGRKLAPSTVPAPFLAQVQEDLNWLEALPWGVNPLPDIATAYQRFHRGIGLIRGWQHDESRLIEGVQLIERCPPALAETGAAEAILQLSTYDVVTCVPEGARAALRHADRAIFLAPNVIEAHLARIQALTALNRYQPGALKKAQDALKAVQRAAPDHPRLPSAGAAVYLALGHYPLVITSLRRAIKLAPTKEEANALLEQFAQVLARSGNLRGSMNLRGQLATNTATPYDAEVPVMAPASLPALDESD